MRRLKVELCFAFQRHCEHRRSRSRLSDPFGVTIVILISFDVGAGVFGRREPHIVPLRGNMPLQVSALQHASMATWHAGMLAVKRSTLRGGPVARRSGWKGAAIRMGIRRRGIGMIVAACLPRKGPSRDWLSRRGDQALTATVAWTGGRPRPRLRSSAARRR